MSVKKILNNTLVKDTLIYGFTNALYTGLPLILLPFLVIILEPKDYGMVDLFRTISMFMVPFLGLSAVQSIGRFYFDLDKETFKSFVSSIQFFQVITAALAILFLVGISSFIDNEYVILLILSVFYFLFNQFIESLLIIFRVEQKPKKYLLIRGGNIILELLLLVFLYKLFSTQDWTFRVYPTVIATFVIAVVSGVCFWKMGYKFYFSKDLLSKALIYSSPLILHMVSGYVLNIGDRLFIKHYLTETDLGNYAVAYQLGMAINFFYTSFNLAWTPTYFKWMKEDKQKKIAKVRKVVYVGIIFMAIMIMLLWLVASPYLRNNTNYNISTHIVWIVLISNIFLCFYKFEANFLLYNKNTKSLSYISLISALISIIINILIIPKIGILGAAYATLVSFILMYALIFKFNNNEKNNNESKI